MVAGFTHRVSLSTDMYSIEVNDTNSEMTATELMEEFGYQTTIKIFGAITCFTIILGIPGNVFAYMTASRFTQNSSGQTFIKCLAVSDMIAGVQDGVLESTLHLIGYDIFKYHPLLCRWLGFFTYASTVSAGYVLLATAVDRMIAICRPIWYKQNSKPIRAVITTILIWILNIVGTIPIFFEYDLEGMYCNYVFMNQWAILREEWQFQVYYEFIFVAGFITPGVTVLIVNLVIVYKMRNTHNKLSRREKERTVCLIVLSVSFLFCLGGLGFLNRLSTVLRDSNPSEANLVNYIRKFPAVFNNSMNFYAYFATSSYFRRVFFQTMGLSPANVASRNT
ncbi:C5a anaphylatoxin chemotactic receptor 1-like [Symsagittifera roscoffensis]|uniref:C5a anaphylatoxin chemotactic receptor 1-like n=1 Tax=Symsagittifera roscoffensis TaxID=84072 RepID=UPI00307C7EEC